jgi:hypothetical protein
LLIFYRKIRVEEKIVLGMLALAVVNKEKFIFQQQRKFAAVTISARV